MQLKTVGSYGNTTKNNSQPTVQTIATEIMKPYIAIAIYSSLYIAS